MFKLFVLVSIFQKMDNQEIHFSISGQSRFPFFYFWTVNVSVSHMLWSAPHGDKPPAVALTGEGRSVLCPKPPLPVPAPDLVWSLLALHLERTHATADEAPTVVYGRPYLIFSKNVFLPTPFVPTPFSLSREMFIKNHYKIINGLIN